MKRAIVIGATGTIGRYSPVTQRTYVPWGSNDE